jgi:hypothetical protein
MTLALALAAALLAAWRLSRDELSQRLSGC